MPDVQHRNLGPGNRHPIHDYGTVANAAARLALAVTQADVGQVVQQADDLSFWILGRVTGGTMWLRLDNVAGATGAPVDAPYLTTAPTDGLSAERVLGINSGGIIDTTAPGVALIDLRAARLPLLRWTVDAGAHDGNVDAALATLAPFTADDVGKMALDLYRTALYVLRTTAPEWIEIPTAATVAGKVNQTDYNTAIGSINTQLTTLSNTVGTKADRDFTINAQTGTAYTLAVADDGRLITMSNAAASTLTVPANATVAIPVGASIPVLQLGAGQVTIAAATNVTFVSSTSAPYRTSAQYAPPTLLTKIATNTWLVTVA